MTKGKRFNVVREVNHERVLDMYSAKGKFVQRVHWEHREDETLPVVEDQSSWTPPLLAAIGDSRLANSVTVTSTTPFRVNWNNDGIITWFMFLSYQKYIFPYDYDLAVSGTTVALIKATVASVLALNPKPKYCIVNGGTNSIAASVTLASMQSDFQDIASSLVAGGVIPVFLIDQPRAIATWDATAKSLHLSLNVWLRSWCSANGYSLADPYSLLVDVNNEPLAGYKCPDGIHQSCTEAYYCGKSLADVFQLIQSKAIVTTRQKSALDIYDAVSNPTGNLIGAIGLMEGTTGTELGTGASGDTPTGWNNRMVSGTATTVSSKESPRSDGEVGDKVILTMAAGATAVIRFSMISNLAKGTVFTGGDRLVVEFDLDVLDGSVGLNYVVLQFTETGGADYGQTYTFKGANTGAYPLPNVAFSGRIRSPLMVIGATPTDVYLRIESQIVTGGSAVIKIGNVTIRKILTGIIM